VANRVVEEEKSSRGGCCEAVALQSVALLLLLHFVLAHYRKGRHSRCGAL
jgi:hypothetical protein